MVVASGPRKATKTRIEDSPLCRDLPECVQPVGTGDNAALQQTGCLQSETAWDISARQSNGHFRASTERLNVPKQLSPEFLLVDLVNELSDLAEDRDAVLSRVRARAKKMDPRKLSRAVSLYGKYSTQKKFREMLQYAG